MNKKEESMNDARRSMAVGGSPGPVYFLGFIGALVYYLHQAHSFWPIVLAILKALVWPAFLVYNVLKFFALG